MNASDMNTTTYSVVFLLLILFIAFAIICAIAFANKKTNLSVLFGTISFVTLICILFLYLVDTEKIPNIFSKLTVDNPSVTDTDNKEVVRIPVTNKYSDSENIDSKYPVIKEQEVYSDDNISVTASGIDYDDLWDCYIINLNIKNKRSIDIYYEIDRAIVNGYTINTMSFGSIYAGMGADFEFGLPKDEIENAGIKKIMEVSFTLELSDDAKNERIGNIDISLQTSAYGSYTETYDFDGEEVYNENGIRILAAPNPKFSVSSPLILLIENSSDRIVMIDYEDLAYNNTMILEMQTGPYILPHSYRLEKMNIFFFGDEPQIDTVEKVTLKFSILPFRSDSSFSTGDIIDTAPVTINFK